VFARAMSERNDFWITKAEWEESGAKCIQRMSDTMKL